VIVQNTQCFRRRWVALPRVHSKRRLFFNNQATIIVSLAARMCELLL
jgi:hypothetical protein